MGLPAPFLFIAISPGFSKPQHFQIPKSGYCGVAENVVILWKINIIDNDRTKQISR